MGGDPQNQEGNDVERTFDAHHDPGAMRVYPPFGGYLYCFSGDIVLNDL